jgi:hypothetical protein
MTVRTLSVKDRYTALTIFPYFFMQCSLFLPACITHDLYLYKRQMKQDI